MIDDDDDDCDGDDDGDGDNYNNDKYDGIISYYDKSS